MAQLKIKIKNLKTGQIREITEKAYNILKKTKALRGFDLIDQPTKIKVKAPVEEPKVEEVESIIPKVDTNEDGQRSAKEVIAAISKSTTRSQVKALIDGEKRKSVLQAAQKKNSKLKK